jgi:N-acetylglutamate synthase-like GNAT family acetyltransferase
MDGLPSAEIRRAAPGDYENVAALLRNSQLPLAGLKEHFGKALVAVRGSSVVGCVAIEVHGGAGLLRSLVVAGSERGRGLGTRLTSEALDLAAAAGIRDVYLLTETAAEFFPAFGFEREERSRAPESLLESEEFRSACPQSAILMHMRVKP